jgi:hypothetical protein
LAAENIYQHLEAEEGLDINLKLMKDFRTKLDEVYALEAAAGPDDFNQKR